MRYAIMCLLAVVAICASVLFVVGALVVLLVWAVARHLVREQELDESAPAPYPPEMDRRNR